MSRTVSRRSSTGHSLILETVPSPKTTRRPSISLKASPPPLATTLVTEFITSFKELEEHKNGKAVVVDGHTLSIAAVTAASRYKTPVHLTGSMRLKDRVNKGRKMMADKVDNGISIYGVTTGFGGSADTRTELPLALGHALLQMQHCGVLPSSTEPLEVLPLSDPMGSTSMPEAWVRGAMLIRMNSLVRGHSGVRWELIEKINQLLDANITPLVPLRGSISASGDLSPLSYIAGTVAGNPSIRVFDGDAKLGTRRIVSSCDALAAHNINPLSLAPKEPLGILNGTAFSAAVAALALNDAVHLALLSQVMTAMAVEALTGVRGSFHPFIHDVARPHPGQIETAKVIWDLLEGSQFAVLEEKEVTIKEDKGHLRQDRYDLRTAPQFIGPQIEDLLASLVTVTQECNSTTDNPLLDGETGTVHNGGNFQAMAVTNAMEKTRLSLHHIGKIMFAQCAELMDPSMNRGLPPNMSATDPSLDYHGKGVDIATAAYVAELGYLANPVSTHIQSAEMHNQAINSLALISGRQTISSLEVLSILMASYLYMLCQALDLRAMQREVTQGVHQIACEELATFMGKLMSQSDFATVTASVCSALSEALDTTTTMDTVDRMPKVASSMSTVLIDFVTQAPSIQPAAVGPILQSIPSIRSKVTSRSEELIKQIRAAYIFGERGPAPASKYLNKTRPLYSFIRLNLGIKMHGSENYHRFPNGHGHDEQTTGQHISLIHEAIRDGKLQSVIVSMLS